MNQQDIDKSKTWCEKCQNHHEVFKTANHTLSEFFDWIILHQSDESRKGWDLVAKFMQRVEYELLRKEISKDGYRL